MKKTAKQTATVSRMKSAAIAPRGESQGARLARSAARCSSAAMCGSVHGMYIETF